MEKSELESLLKAGMSAKEMEPIFHIKSRTILYWIHKYELEDLMKYKVGKPYRFEKIDSKEKAYTLGFILADSGINNRRCDISTVIKDKEVLEFIAEVIDAVPHYDYTFDKKTRRFPRARTSKKIVDILKFTGGEKKQDRHYPRVPKEYERYLLQGFFEADGMISWGRRKDRNRLWHKISFKSSYNLLIGVQAALSRLIGISTSIHPVKNENCFVLEFANRKDVLKFLNFVYPDDSFIVLQRKYLNQYALRLELEENGETSYQSQHRAEYTEYKGVETSGAVAIPLNNRTSIQAANQQ